MFLIFCSSVKKALVRKHPLEDFKQRRYFENNLTPEKAYQSIMSRVGEN